MPSSKLVAGRMVQHMLSWMEPKPKGEHRRYGSSLFTLAFQLPYRLGSLASCSGNHHPCEATTTPGLMFACTWACMLQAPNMFSMVTQPPSTTPYSSAVCGLISTHGHGSISRSDWIMRCSLWNDVYLRMPVVSESG